MNFVCNGSPIFDAPIMTTSGIGNTAFDQSYTLGVTGAIKHYSVAWFDSETDLFDQFPF